MIRFVLLLIAALLLFDSCAADEATDQLRKENAGVAGAAPGESRLNEHGGIAW